MNNDWHPINRMFHWLTLPLVIACLCAVWAHEAFDKTDPVRAQLMQLHFLLGGSIGILTVLRFVMRAAIAAPWHRMPERMRQMAHLAHLLLYMLLLALPVLGYIAVSGKGLPINLFNLLELPPLAVDKALAHQVKEIHEGLASAFIALVGLHVAAALYHTLFLKDQIMAAMLGRSR